MATITLERLHRGFKGGARVTHDKATAMLSEANRANQAGMGQLQESFLKAADPYAFSATAANRQVHFLTPKPLGKN